VLGADEEADEREEADEDEGRMDEGDSPDEELEDDGRGRKVSLVGNCRLVARGLRREEEMAAELAGDDECVVDVIC
jgi:hypothetical protein